MKKITIPFSGISRNTDDTISTDGDCMELINARVKNGSISPVGQPILETITVGNRKPIYIHKNSEYEHYLSYDSSEGKLYYEYNKISGVYILVNSLICNTFNIVSIENIGNTLIIVTDVEILYSIFTNGKYKSLGGKPQLPLIAFSKGTSGYASEGVPGIHDLTYGEISDADGRKQRFDAYKTACKGAINKTKDTLLSNKYLYKNCFIRYAIRMFDGSLIKHSPVYVIMDGSASIYSNSGTAYPWYLDLSRVMSTTRINGYRIDFEVKDDMKINEWKEVVRSVDIFISEFNQYEDEPPLPDKDSSTKSWDIIKDLQDSFENVTNFYLIKSIPVGDIFKGMTADREKDPNDRPGPDRTKIDKYIKGMILDSSIIKNLVQQDSLGVDSFSFNEITGKHSFSYNSRLHIGNIRTKIFSGYKYSYLANELGNDKESVVRSEIVTLLNSESGKAILVSLDSGVSSDGLSPVIIYPDIRAYDITIKAKTTTGNKCISLNLKKHPFLNCAYYQDPKLEPIRLKDDSSISISETQESNSIEISSNKLKVSALNNPIYFPAAQTYTVSNGGIIGMASATTALSSGQFGQFPLYLFCNDGIYALSVGSESTVYSVSSPLSRDVCVNPQSITSIDNAIVFATEAGIMLLSGSSVQKLSDKMEGYLPSSFNSSPVLGRILNIPKLQGSIVEFRDYIKNASIGYIYEEKEIIVSNKQYSYSYVYNLYSKEWSKLSVSVNSFLNSYPKTLAVFTEKSGCGIYNLYNPHRTINNIAIISRPVKFGSLTHKRILQSALRGIIKPSLSDVYFRGEPVQFREENVQIFSEAGFYILGSNDAEHFSLLAGTEKLNDIRDLITKMNKTKAYKYFIFCLVGGVRTDVAINYIEVMADEAFDNRLR